MSGGRQVVLVAAVADNGVIGRGGGIPWRIPADFAHFKQTTLGQPLVMGRRTFEGIATHLGGPLPGRQSIVVTGDRTWSYPGVLVARSVAEAVEVGHRIDEVVMIGGGAGVYAEALPLATGQILTEVHARPDGDTYYPEFDRGEWVEERREPHLDPDVDGATPYEFTWLRRRVID